MHGQHGPSHIKRHNNKILYNNNFGNEEACQCRNQNECPRMGSCAKKSLDYQATITLNNDTINKTYIDMTEGPSKPDSTTARLSLNQKKYSTKTTLQ